MNKMVDRVLKADWHSKGRMGLLQVLTIHNYNVLSGDPNLPAIMVRCSAINDLTSCASDLYIALLSNMMKSEEYPDPAEAWADIWLGVQIQKYPPV